ncbi:UNVERIFIED_CONTAM: hypothetical protein NCL1_34771 [Trichonephila clavipes]
MVNGRTKKKFQQFGIFHSKLSIVESMVSYYDHHSAKLFIKGKPITFGYKIWMLCSRSGYPSMKIYCRKKPELENSPQGSSVYPKLENPDKHEIFFDIFFPSHKLLT